MVYLKIVANTKCIRLSIFSFILNESKKTLIICENSFLKKIKMKSEFEPSVGNSWKTCERILEWETTKVKIKVILRKF